MHGQPHIKINSEFDPIVRNSI